VAGALQTDEFSNILEILPEHKLVAARDNRHIAHAESEQFFAAACIVQDIDGDELNLFFRKKLFRSKAATSSRLCKENELVGNGAHEYARGEVEEGRSVLPAAFMRQAHTVARQRAKTQCYNHDDSSNTILVKSQ
jgi:hypothetical protein